MGSPQLTLALYIGGGDVSRRRLLTFRSVVHTSLERPAFNSRLHNTENTGLDVQSTSENDTFDNPDPLEPYELKHGAIAYPYLWGGPSGSSVPGGFTGRIWVCSEQLEPVEVQFSKKKIGDLYWYGDEIEYVHVEPGYLRIGLATSMYLDARKLMPKLCHSKQLNDDSRKWIEGMKLRGID